MSDAIFIGVGRHRGFWRADTNHCWKLDNGDDDGVGLAGLTGKLETSDWGSAMDQYVGQGPQVGDYLKVRTAGNTEINGETNWEQGDYVVFCKGSPNAWKKVSATDTAAAMIIGDADGDTWANSILKTNNATLTFGIDEDANAGSGYFEWKNNGDTQIAKLDENGDLQIDGDLTLNGTSIDVDAASALTIGATVGANNLTLGGASSTVVVAGDLTVAGTTTTINSATLSVDDKNIELGSVGSPSDSTATGGGITLKGSSDYTILWTASTDKWHYNQGIQIEAATNSPTDLTGLVIKNTSTGTQAHGGQVRFDFNDTGGNNADAGYIRVKKEQEWTDGDAADQDSKMEFDVVQNGTSGNALTLTSAKDAQVAGNIKVGGNIIQASDGGSTITMDNSDNVTIAGNLSVAGNSINGSYAGTHIQLDGSSHKVEIKDDLTIAGTGKNLIVKAPADMPATVHLQADMGDDAGDEWKVVANADQSFTIGNDIASAGTFVDHLKITPHATAVQSLVTVAGDLQITNGNIKNHQGEIVFTMNSDQDGFVIGDWTIGGGDLTINGPQDSPATVLLRADGGDDAGDEWKVIANADHSFTIGNDIASAGSFVDHLKITPHATATSSEVEVAGILKLGGDKITTSAGNQALVFDTSTTPDTMKVFTNFQLQSGFIHNSAGSPAIQIGSPAATDVKFFGDIKLTGGDIRNSDDEVCITIAADQSTTFSGDVKSAANQDLVFKTTESMKFYVDTDDDDSGGSQAGWNFYNGSGAEIISFQETGDAAFNTITLAGNVIKASDGGSTIILDTADNVEIAGDLTVSGGDISGPTDDHLNIKSDKFVRIYLDNDDDSNLGKFQIFDSKNDAPMFEIVEPHAGMGTATVSSSMTIKNDNTGHLDALTLWNQNDASGTGAKTGLRFSMAETVAGAQVDAGRIYVEKEQTWVASDLATLDSSMKFQTIQNNVSADRMIIKSDGKVGIGAASPSKKLHVEDSSGYQLQLDGGNNYWNVGAGWSGYYDGTFLIANNTGDKLAIDTSGKVGIGTKGPEGKLHVYSGDASIAPSALADELVVEGAGSTGISILTPNDQVGRLYFGDSDNAARAYVLYDHSVDMMKFSVASGNRLVIDNSGQVGIGVEDPDSKLEVAGKIHISAEQGSAPSAPSDGDGGFLYAKADGKIYWRSNELTETDLTATGGGGGGGSIDGSGGAARVAYWSDADTLTSDADFTFDGTNITLNGGIDGSGNAYFGSNVVTNLHQFTGSLAVSSSADSGTNNGILAAGYGNNFGLHLYADDFAGLGMQSIVDTNGRGSLEIFSTGGTPKHFKYQAGTTFTGGTGETLNLAVSGSTKHGTDVNSNHYFAGTMNVSLGSISVATHANSANAYGITLPNEDDYIGKGKAFSWETYSSRRFKTNVETIPNALGLVDELRGVSFDWKSSGNSDIGLIAEEVAPVLPSCVSYDPQGLIDGVSYPKLVAVLLQAVKEQTTIIGKLQSDIHELKKLTGLE